MLTVHFIYRLNGKVVPVPRGYPNKLEFPLYRSEDITNEMIVSALIEEEEEFTDKREMIQGLELNWIIGIEYLFGLEQLIQ